MRHLLTLAAIGVSFAQPALSKCGPRPMPSPIEALGAAVVARGEWARFSSAPSFGSDAVAVEISSGDRPTLRALRLERMEDCNNYRVVADERLPLSRHRQMRFFEAIADVQREWKPTESVMMDGTRFAFRHDQGDGTAEFSGPSRDYLEQRKVADLVRRLMIDAGVSFSRNIDRDWRVGW